MKLNEPQLLHLAARAKKSPHKDGYLHKKSGRKNTAPDHATVRWQKRWCVIYYNMFFYYENPQALKPQGVVFLEGSSASHTVVAQTTVFCFALGIPTNDHRQFLFGCNTLEEREEWIQAITSGSCQYMVQENTDLKFKIQELESQVGNIQEEKTKLQKESSDQWTQISRLKLELSVLRNQYGLARKSSKSLSIQKADKADSSSTSSSIGTSNDKEYSASDIKKLIKIQTCIRSWLVRLHWKGFITTFVNTFSVEKLQKRNKLLWQFITAEEDYVQQMMTLMKIFHTPMKNMAYAEDTCLTTKEVNTMFSTSETILALHQLLMQCMESRMKKWPAVHIDDLLFAVMTVVPIYIKYIKNHPLALKTLAECKKRDGFVKMLKWYEGKSECHGQTLEQFLHYPIQVIPNYARNIHDILEVTPTDHIERTSLENILMKLQETQSFNHFLDEGESIRHTLEIERLIVGGCHALLNEDQKFIRHGVLKQLGLESRHQSKREKVRHCFLFSHHLIIASRTIDGKLRLSKLSGKISLAMTTLVEDIEHSMYPDDVKALAFTLLVNTCKTAPTLHSLPVTLMAAKSNEKALWTSDISQCIYNLALEQSDETATYAEEKSVLTEGLHEEQRALVPLLEKPLNYLKPLKDDIRLRKNDDDIKYSEELVGPYHLPQIMHASVDRLIERLADPRLPGAEFMETFLLTYRAFTSGKVVLNGLIESYWSVMGGKPPSKLHIPEMHNVVKRTGSSRGRVHSVLSNSSVSSMDDLDASFNSSVCPFSSTTAFNYNTLKEQLNLPAKQNAATTKWCEDYTVPAENNIKPLVRQRSISACGTSGLETIPNRKLSRCQSVEVLITGNSDSVSNNDFLSGYSKCHSCDDLDSNVLNETKPKIISVSQNNLNNYHSTYKTDIVSNNDFQSSNVSNNDFQLRFDDEFLNNNVDCVENASVNIEIMDIENKRVMISGSIHSNEDMDITPVINDVPAESSAETVSVQEDDLGNGKHPHDTNDVCNSSIADSESFNDTDRQSLMSIAYSEKDEFRDGNQTSLADSLNDMDSSNMLDSFDSVVSSDQSHVAHSKSDEVICKTCDSNLQLPSGSKSLDQKKVFVSPYFRRKKKEYKREKARKARSSSEPPSTGDVPVLINLKDKRMGIVFNRSQSQYDSRGDNTETKNKKKSVVETASAPIPEKSFRPVSVPELSKTKKSPQRRKRSIFTSPFSSFKKGGLKRSSSEQVIAVSDKMVPQGLRPSLSNTNLSLELGSQTSTAKTIQLICENGNVINENEVCLTPLDSPVKFDRLFGRKKKLKESLRILNPSQNSATAPPRRKTSVFEQGRPPVFVKRSVSVNRGPLKIMSIFKHWLAKHPKDFIEDPELVSMLENFFVDIKNDDRTLPVVKEIVSNLEKSISVHRKSLASVHPFDELLLQQHSNDADKLNIISEGQALHTYPVNVVAENMTLLEHYLYAKISFNEFISCQWTKKDKELKAPGIMRFISRFNQVTNIISYTVVHGESTQIRSSIIEFWILVAARCRDLNSFNAIMEIVSALNASSVHRLKKSWELVARPVREVFSDLATLVSADRSLKNLREAVHTCNPPCVPYLGCYLSDIVFVHEGAKTFDDNNLINFAKMCRISRLVREVKCYQQLPYTLELNKEVGYSLVNFDATVNEDILYDQSLLAEPRGS